MHIYVITSHKCNINCWIPPWRWAKKAETSRRFTTRCISQYLNISAVVDIYIYIYGDNSRTLASPDRTTYSNPYTFCQRRPYQVFTAANIYIMAFWVMPLHRLLVGYKLSVKTFVLYRANKSGFVPKPKFSLSLTLSATVTKPFR